MAVIGDAANAADAAIDAAYTYRPEAVCRVWPQKFPDAGVKRDWIVEKPAQLVSLPGCLLRPPMSVRRRRMSPSMDGTNLEERLWYSTMYPVAAFTLPLGCPLEPTTMIMAL